MRGAELHHAHAAAAAAGPGERETNGYGASWRGRRRNESEQHDRRGGVSLGDLQCVRSRGARGPIVRDVIVNGDPISVEKCFRVFVVLSLPPTATQVAGPRWPLRSEAHDAGVAGRTSLSAVSARGLRARATLLSRVPPGQQPVALELVLETLTPVALRRVPRLRGARS